MTNCLSHLGLVYIIVHCIYVQNKINTLWLLNASVCDDMCDRLSFFCK